MICQTVNRFRFILTSLLSPGLILSNSGLGSVVGSHVNDEAPTRLIVPTVRARASLRGAYVTIITRLIENSQVKLRSKAQSCRQRETSGSVNGLTPGDFAFLDSRFTRRFVVSQSVPPVSDRSPRCLDSVERSLSLTLPVPGWVSLRW